MKRIRWITPVLLGLLLGIVIAFALRNDAIANFDPHNVTFGNRTVGKYFTDKQYIFIDGSKDRSYGTMLNTCQHEVGHYVWYETLNYAAQREYQAIFENATEHVSKYAKTNYKEDFAETFNRALVCEWNYSKIPEDRRGFFADWFGYGGYS